ncbi:MAG TPA: type 4a pilus biogenesis protein PilO [bacterium]|nr:type 4a pilus biogenesis protein PilO [bacterium]
MTRRVIKKLILLLLITGITTGAVVYFALMPLLQNIANNKDKLNGAQEDLGQLALETSVLQKASKNQENSDETFNKISSLWPNEKNISAFMVSLESLAKEEGLTISNVAITEPVVVQSKGKKKEPSPSKVLFTFEAEGSYGKVINLTKKLENFSRLTSVHDLKIIAKEADLVSIKVSGGIYYGR